MARRHLHPALVLSAWTLLVWTTRIRNIWTDASLTTAGQLWRTALAAVFTAFAVATVAVWLRVRGRRTVSWAPRLVRMFTVWTIGVWVVRAVQIGAGDHTAGFKVVHSALAVVSAGLALWADQRAHAVSRGPGARPVRA